jgi:membrane protein DedA with SNARE-associated domain
MSGVLHWLINAVSQHGYIIVFLVIAAESAGAPLPGETVLLVAAFLARQGHLNIGVVIAVAAAAAIIGDNGGYWIGRKGGRAMAKSFGRFILLTPARLQRCEA